MIGKAMLYCRKFMLSNAEYPKLYLQYRTQSSSFRGRPDVTYVLYLRAEFPSSLGKCNAAEFQHGGTM
jgi:hypothetical protein